MFRNQFLVSTLSGKNELNNLDNWQPVSCRTIDTLMLMYPIYISRFSGSFVKLGRSRRSITNATICMQVFYKCLTVQSKWNPQVEITKGLDILNKSLCSASWLYTSFVSYHNLLMGEWFCHTFDLLFRPGWALSSAVIHHGAIKYNFTHQSHCQVSYHIPWPFSICILHHHVRSGDFLFRTAVVTKQFRSTGQWG